MISSAKATAPTTGTCDIQLAGECSFVNHYAYRASLLKEILAKKKLVVRQALQSASNFDTGTVDVTTHLMRSQEQAHLRYFIHGAHAAHGHHRQ